MLLEMSLSARDLFMRRVATPLEALAERYRAASESFLDQAPDDAEAWDDFDRSGACAELEAQVRPVDADPESSSDMWEDLYRACTGLQDAIVAARILDTTRMRLLEVEPFEGEWVHEWRKASSLLPGDAGAALEIVCDILDPQIRPAQIHTLAQFVIEDGVAIHIDSHPTAGYRLSVSGEAPRFCETARAAWDMAIPYLTPGARLAYGSLPFSWAQPISAGIQDLFAATRLLHPGWKTFKATCHGLEGTAVAGAGFIVQMVTGRRPSQPVIWEQPAGTLLVQWEALGRPVFEAAAQGQTFRLESISKEVHFALIPACLAEMGPR